MDDDVIVLHSIEMSGGDDRRPVKVQVEKRTTHHNGDRTFINVVLCVGQKQVFIPRRVVGEVAEALSQLAVVANAEYTKLLEDANCKGR